MTAPNTTPGPWEALQEYDVSVDAVSSDHNQLAGWMAVGNPKAFNGEVAAVLWFHGNEEARLDANAHLIAAAPELYEALEAADKALTLEGFTVTHPVIIQITAALAKARGEA